MKENTTALQHLLDHGVKMKEANHKKTPLHYAAEKGHNAIVEILIKYKADVNCVDENGTTPLHYAVNRGYTDVVQVLLKYGADVNIQDDAAEMREKAQLKLKYARLSQTLNSSMETFARHMIEVKLIGRGVMRSLNYDDIMEQFMSAMEFKHSIPELQEHCQLFIGVLEKLGGAPKKAADEFATAWSHLEPASLNEIRQKCVLITYAVLPSVIPAVLKDLRDPAVLKELEDVGVTVVQLPDVLKSGNESTGGLGCLDRHAAKEGHSDVIQTLINHGVDLSVMDEVILMVVRTMIEYGADINVIEEGLGGGVCLTEKMSDEYLEQLLDEVPQLHEVCNYAAEMREKAQLATSESRDLSIPVELKNK
ncbi:ankyrin repeat domain-containing protein 50-like [Gigantopelta aegis]|uniref:ankyrin repeat domain-containing protein 50-like n=1 Tax=Gigantopelta aegis TaxID=1735272 RepID=UPI001B889CC7|nr:ankyrin repeat domain-containing protein 50-like [Gigantopelta aegis]